jgi:hypothetical protein
MDIQDRRSRAVLFRAYVCPRDYLQFAVSERVRWTLVSLEPDPGSPLGVTIVPVRPGSDPHELFTLLSLRGLTAWARLAHDIAEGRVRRVFLRELPPDPDIREALVSFLHSAGAEIMYD